MAGQPSGFVLPKQPYSVESPVEGLNLDPVESSFGRVGKKEGVSRYGLSDRERGQLTLKLKRDDESSQYETGCLGTQISV